MDEAPERVGETRLWDRGGDRYLGSVRFSLSLLVMISHFPPNGLPLNVGVCAVICFYFLSGYLMRRSYARFELNSSRPVRDFSLDRLIKLFPQYLVVCWSTIALIHALGPSQRVPFMAQEISAAKIALNTLLVPANYVFPPLVVTELLPHPIVPPAWSLSTEVHFYLLLPLLFRAPRAVWIGALAASGLVQWSSFWFSDPGFSTVTVGYRYIVGVLVVFLYGYGFAEQDPGKRRAAWCVWAIYSLHLTWLLGSAAPIRNAIVLEVVLAGVIALPLGVLVTRRKWPQGRARSLDRALGDLAYPVFLTHFLAFYLSEKVFGTTFDTPLRCFALSLAICLSASALLAIGQRRLDRYRIARRGFASLAAA